MPLPISLLHISVLVILLACSALLRGDSPAVAHEQTCTSRDLPNPLASIFPNNATGVLNATLAIVPIPIEAARRLIPHQYGILEHAYRSILPSFPEGMYPLFVQAAHDHDVQLKAYGITLDDFSVSAWSEELIPIRTNVVQRVGLEFPFLDLLGDGYSSFRWAPAQLITADHQIALQGSMAYGTEVFPAQFEPLCDAYQMLPGRSTYFKATSLVEHVEVEFSQQPSSATGPYSVEFFKNITNQPTFANGSACDNMIRLFNSSMSTGAYEPVVVKGRVKANVPPLQAEEEWSGVYGIQVATPFIENNYLDCRTMQGYAGTGGPGDSYIPTTSNRMNDL
jgi:hypothetical protein